MRLELKILRDSELVNYLMQIGMIKCIDGNAVFIQLRGLGDNS